MRAPRQGLKRVQKFAETLHEQHAEMAKFSAVVQGMDAGAARTEIDAQERTSEQF
jgi:hypothetical protein